MLRSLSTSALGIRDGPTTPSGAGVESDDDVNTPSTIKTPGGVVSTLLPLQVYNLVKPTINDDMEGTTRTRLELKAREHAASIALMQVRHTF